MEIAGHDIETEAAPTARGRFAFEADDGFCVTFRRADRGPSTALAAVAAAIVVGATLASLLGAGETGAIAWMLAGLVDFALLYVIYALHRGTSRGGVSVDAAERRVFLPEGAELVFERLVALRVREQGPLAELVLVHDAGEIALGLRPAAEVREAATAVARITELPLERR